MNPSQRAALDAVRKDASAITDRKDKTLIKKLKRILMAGNHAPSIEALNSELGCSKDKLIDLIGALTDQGMIISIHKSVVTTTLEPPVGSEVHNIKATGLQTLRFGVLADTHLASRYCRLDALNAMYDIYAQEGIDTVFLLGNMVDGECRFNRNDLFAHGIDEQANYFIDNYPQRKGIVTKFITGDDHEGWWIQREGIDVGKHFSREAASQGRDDLIYLGHMEHNVEIRRLHGSAYMRLLHAGGGSAYAYSYTSQKILESFQGGEKPTILLIGHYHKFDYTYPRGTHALQAGCFQDQTPFMRKKKLEAMLGGTIIEIQQDERGIVRSFGTKWCPFYDRSFYKGQTWKYHWSRPS